MTRLVLFNKPFRVLSQFRESGAKLTLSSYFDDPSLRVAGRLDYDSEGLLLLISRCRKPIGHSLRARSPGMHLSNFVAG